MPPRKPFNSPEHADKILRAALSYAVRGWRVLPLKPGTKVPALPAWQEHATCDAEVIATWFGGEYRGCNLGIATGRASNLWVLDIDTGHGPAAADSVAALEREHKPLTPTYTVTTPSGGTHLFYAWPAEVPDPEGRLPTWRNVASTVLGEGIDIRAEGGQVAVWPSVLRDGSRYKRTTKNEPVRVPKWLARLTQHVEPIRTGSSLSKFELTADAGDAATRWAQQGIQGVLEDLDAMRAAATPTKEEYRGAPWDSTTFQRAARLIEFAHADWAPISVDDARTLLFDHAPRDKDFDDRAVDRIFKSALRKVAGVPARLPDSVIGPYVFEGYPPPGRRATSAGTGPAAPAPPSSPDAYFDRSGFMPDAIGRAVNNGDIATGADGGFWEYAAGVWRPEAHVVEHRVARLLQARYRQGIVPSVETMLRACGLPRITDAPHESAVNLRTGMVYWASRKVVPHDPSWLSTTQLAADWEPDGPCPEFDRWVAEVLDPALHQRLWEVIAYMLLQGNPLQRAILLYGGAGTGKSTLIRVLQRIIGTHNTASVSLVQMVEGKFEVAELYGKQANLAGDIEAKYLRDTAMFKALTGQDMVLAQRKHRDPFHFVCHATPLFSANEVPRSIDTSDAYHRRWVVLPMDRKVRGSRALDEEDLYAEAAGIVSKALRYLPGLMRAREFDTPVQAQVAQERFAEASNIVATWLRDDDAIEIRDPGTEGSFLWRLQSEVYARYRVWSDANGHATLSSMRFFDRLQAAGFERTSRRGRTGFKGLRLRSDADGRMPFGGVVGPEVLSAPDEPVS